MCDTSSLPREGAKCGHAHHFVRGAHLWVNLVTITAGQTARARLLCLESDFSAEGLAMAVLVARPFPH